MAEGTDECEVVRPCLGIAFSNPPDLAIVTAGRTEYQPSREIRNISVDGYRHTLIISPLPQACARRRSI